MRVVVAAIDDGQNEETAAWIGAALHDRPVEDNQTRVVVLFPSRTNATKPRGPAASSTWEMLLGPVAASVQTSPSVELRNRWSVVTRTPPCPTTFPNPVPDGVIFSSHVAPPSFETQLAASFEIRSLPVSTIPIAPPETPLR